MADTDTTIETSGQLFLIVEDGAIFEPYNKVNEIGGKFLSFERCADDEDGTFPNITSYIKLVNRMDKDGTVAFLSWYGGSKMKFDSGYCTVIRTGSKYGCSATLEFKKPITVLFGKVGDKMITEQVTKIHGEFTHEWFWMKGTRRQDQVANGFEVYFDCKTFE